MKPSYELSENQKKFVRSAKKQGLKVSYDYSGRGMFGTCCPSVKVGSPAEFRTRASVRWDNLGFDFVVYAAT